MTASDSWGYRPQLDGLRAIAVYMVVAFHSGVAHLAGGFIGVDLFFVLSGYLVTSVLLRDVTADRSARRGRFYARRIRRLFPAAGLNLLVTALVFRAIGNPTERDSATSAMTAASLSVSNWWFIREGSNYFGSNITAGPVAHYWSLAVEEQFYLLWPLLLAAVIFAARRLGRPHKSWVAIVCAVLGVASVAAALILAIDQPNRSYYGTDTRAYQLFAGAALAAVRARMEIGSARQATDRAIGGAGIALIGLLLLASSWLVSVGPVTRGVLATAITCGLIVTLEMSPAGIAGRVLSAPSLTFLGRISYGTYLWHWIVIMVIGREFQLSPMATFTVTVGVATGIAALSYELIERPVRASSVLDRATPAVIGCGLAAILLVGLVAVPRISGLSETGSSTAAAGKSARLGTPVTVDWKAASKQLPDLEPCDMGRNGVCTLVKGTGPKILLVGDSHAAMLAPTFTELAQRHDLTLASAYLPFCPWVQGIMYDPTFGPNCFANQKDLYEQRIPRFRPDIVILVHRTLDDLSDPMLIKDQDLGNLPIGKDRSRPVARRVRSTITALQKQVPKIVMVEPIPISSSQAAPLSCLAQAQFVEECRFVTATSPWSEERAFRSLAARQNGVWSLDIDEAVCPYKPICDPIIDGHVTMYDNTHLTTGFAGSLAAAVDRQLISEGVLAR